MPSRRDMITMDEQEIWQFIESRKAIQVCTLNRDGTPHLTTMWFAVLDKTGEDRGQELHHRREHPVRRGTCRLREVDEGLMAATPTRTKNERASSRESR